MKKTFDKKSIILIIILVISIFVFLSLSYILYSYFSNKLSFEDFALDIYDKNNKQIFTIDKIER